MKRKNFTVHQISLFNSLIDSEKATLLKEINELNETIAKKKQRFKELESQQIHLTLTKPNGTTIAFLDQIKSKTILSGSKWSETEYNSKYSSWKKVLFILNKEDKVLTARQIITVMYNFEPELRFVQKDKKKTIEDNIFAILSKASKKGELIRFKKEAELKIEYKYGLKRWMDNNNKLKSEYLI